MEILPDIDVSFLRPIEVIMSIRFKSQVIFVNFAVKFVKYACL